MSKDPLSKIRANDVYRALVRVLQDYGIKSHTVVDKRPHPHLVFEFEGKERSFEFAGTPSSVFSPKGHSGSLRRDLRQWRIEAAAGAAQPAPQVRTSPVSALTYKGHGIQCDGETLCLTDMWRSAGADPSKRPVEWLRSKAAKDFVEHLEIMVGNSHLLQTEMGRGGATFAHWQIGMAYAKYLSPEFHAWCNEVVRAKMQVAASPAFANLPPETVEMIRAVEGMCKMLARKVTQIEQAVPVMIGERLEAAMAADPRRAVLDYVSVRQILDEAKALPKGRRSLNARVGHDLRTRAATAADPVALRRCAHSNVWLFPVDHARAYMQDRGASLVADHNARVSGQGVLPFRRKGQPEARA